MDPKAKDSLAEKAASITCIQTIIVNLFSFGKEVASSQNKAFPFSPYSVLSASINTIFNKSLFLLFRKPSNVSNFSVLSQCLLFAVYKQCGVGFCRSVYETMLQDTCDQTEDRV